MIAKKDVKTLLLFLAVFIGAFYLPVGEARFDNAISESFHLLKSYAREHVLLCLIPAFFIAGGISVFISQASVMKYLGAKANKFLAYSVASVSGSVLAVCSCTVLPLFAGIYRMGAGLGPATAFLYSGPAINVLAIALTARVLGIEIGIARAVGAVLFSIVIGLLMHLFFRKDEHARQAVHSAMPEPEVARPLWQNAVYFGTMIGILVFANWGTPGEASGFWQTVYSVKWFITGAFAAAFGAILIAWLDILWWKVVAAASPAIILAFLFPDAPILAFGAGVVGLCVITGSGRGESKEWFDSTWVFAQQILPLLFFGVLIAGALLGRPNHEGLIPSAWVTSAVGGNSLFANFFASIAGAFMYFATLTEVPILQGLIGAGMGKGPALALLLAGPALSLPNMLVIRKIMGTKKTVIYVSLVVVMATFTGMVFGAIM
ncbi:permease [bacterium]|nr:permease [bacterium]